MGSHLSAAHICKLLWHLHTHTHTGIQEYINYVLKQQRENGRKSCIKMCKKYTIFKTICIA